MRRASVLICLLAVAGACAAPAGANASGRSPAEVQRLEDEGVRDIIVARDPGLAPAERGAMRATAGVAHLTDLPIANTEVVRAPTGGLVEALAELSAEPGVLYAEPNGPVHAATADDFWPQQWGLENAGVPINGAPGTPDADIDAPEAWAQSTGAGQTVAVVDSGVSATHEDLQGALWANPGETGAGRATNGIDDDHDGAVDDAQGWNALTRTTNVTDVAGHGTHVTGTIVARKDNAVGIAGVAPGAQVFPLSALDAAGNGTDASIASAFDVAGNLGIPIVNASVEAGVSSAVRTAIDAHPNTLYVLAAGNTGADDDAAATSSLCHLPEANIICVGGSDARDAPATFQLGSTNTGASTVDLFAPSDNIASTYVPFADCPAAPCYAFLDGTSMAAPHVAGTLALMRARNPALTAAELKAKLLASVDVKAALAGKSVTGGRLNAAAAVAAAAPAAASSPAPAAAASGAAGAGTAPAPSPAASSATGVVVPSVPVVPVLGRPSIGAGALTARHPLTIRFALTRAATVRLTISRGGRTVATATVHGAKGTNRYVLRTKVGSHRLARGRYRVRVQARGAARAYALAVTVR